MLKTLSQYFLNDVKGVIEDLEFNDDFWLPPQFVYWPSPKLMKELITKGSKAATIYDIVF